MEVFTVVMGTNFAFDNPGEDSASCNDLRGPPSSDMFNVASPLEFPPLNQC
jgi:hypothetical protein